MSERRRLNDRIFAIRGTDLARDLKRERNRLCKPAEVDARKCGMVVMHAHGRKFLEPADLIAKLHAWLDVRGVIKHPPSHKETT